MKSYIRFKFIIFNCNCLTFYTLEHKGEEEKDSEAASANPEILEDITKEMEACGFIAAQATQHTKSFEPILSPDSFHQMIHEMLDAKVSLYYKMKISKFKNTVNN